MLETPVINTNSRQHWTFSFTVCCLVVFHHLFLIVIYGGSDPWLPSSCCECPRPFQLCSALPGSGFRLTCWRLSGLWGRTVGFGVAFSCFLLFCVWLLLLCAWLSLKTFPALIWERGAESSPKGASLATSMSVAWCHLSWIYCNGYKHLGVCNSK